MKPWSSISASCFLTSEVPGHAGKLVFGLLADHIPVVLMVGRAHYYEGHSIHQVTFPIRVFKLLGIETIVCENPARSPARDIFSNRAQINSNKRRRRPQYRICGWRHRDHQRCMSNNHVRMLQVRHTDIVEKLQHIFPAGFAGTHPLRGPNPEEFGPRFPPLSDAYDLELRRHAHQAWKAVISENSKRRLHEGVYAFVAGPRWVTTSPGP
jgi:purine-nucleoside phosphorylase